MSNLHLPKIDRLTFIGALSILCVLSFSMRLLEDRKTATQREIYYTFVKHFAAQVRDGSSSIRVHCVCSPCSSPYRLEEGVSKRLSSPQGSGGYLDPQDPRPDTAMRGKHPQCHWPGGGASHDKNCPFPSCMYGMCVPKKAYRSKGT